jgi:SAM-dependent methyltransferase
MLSRKYEHVVAVDISGKVLEIARRRHARHRNITFLHADTECELPVEAVDFILTVTVLNHIMDDASLRATMEHLAGVLAPGGRFVALESCGTTPAATRSSYQRNHTHGEWKTMFEHCGLVLEDCFGFYHPTADRCRTFDRYSRSLPVRLLRRMGPSRMTTRVLGAVATLYLLGQRDYFWPARPTDALRLMVFRKPVAACACAKKRESTEAPCECADSQLPALDLRATRPPAFAPAPRIHPGG